MLGAKTSLHRLTGRPAAGALTGTLAEAIADELGTLRGLALKVGQMASYVDGVVPDGQREIYEQALSKLRSRAAAMRPEAAARVIEAELGARPLDLFATFEERPFASASIGQVHRATLADGRQVAVKVQHAGIEQAVHADLANGKLLGRLLGPLGDKFGLDDQLAELRARFTEELDYRHEATAQSRFRSLFAGEPLLRIPEVIASHSARRVLTTTLAEGQPFEIAVTATAAERRAWAASLFRFVFGSVLWEGLLNADPHPGNYVMGEGGLVHVLDFGCTRQLSPERLAIVRQVHHACARGDEPAFLRWALQLVDMVPGSEQGRQAEAYVRTCFHPVLARGPFRFTRAFAASLVGQLRAQAAHVAKSKASEVRALPAELLFFNRLQVGFYSVLARLDVAVDYHAVHAELVEKIAWHTAKATAGPAL